MNDFKKENQILSSDEINHKSFLYDWIILFLIFLLVFVIIIPPVIWAEEEAKTLESRNRMLDLAYALKSYHHLTGEYIDDKELLFETIMHVRDTLIANKFLSGKKNIHLSCIYEATSINDTVKNSKIESIIDLRDIDKKDRLSFIDKTIYDMKSKGNYNGVRIYEVSDIDDVKNIPDEVSVIIEDFNVRTDKLISHRLVAKWKEMNQLTSFELDTTYNQVYEKLIQTDDNENKYDEDEIKFYWGIKSILVKDSNKYNSINEQLEKMTVSLDKIDSLYSDQKLIRFERENCEEIIGIDVPRNFGLMLDTLFSGSSIVTEDVVDTVYTLKEPVDGNLDDLQTSYVKNQYLFRYIPKNEYDSLWHFGIPFAQKTDSVNNLITIDSTYLNKLISDTTYKITYIDDEEFDETEEETSNHLIRKILGIDIWHLIEYNMKNCADYTTERSCIEEEKCDWIQGEGCMEIINIIEEENLSVDKSLEQDSEDFISDDEWASLFEEFETELKNEIEFGDTLKVSYSFESRFISSYEIINRTINIEDYDRKRYNLDANLLYSPINNEEYKIILLGNGEYDEGEEFIDQNKNSIWDSGEFFIDKTNDGYKIIAPLEDVYSEGRFLFFSFKPGSSGYIENDETSWDKKPKWNFPIK